MSLHQISRFGSTFRTSVWVCKQNIHCWSYNNFNHKYRRCARSLAKDSLPTKLLRLFALSLSLPNLTSSGETNLLGVWTADKPFGQQTISEQPSLGLQTREDTCSTLLSSGWCPFCHLGTTISSFLFIAGCWQLKRLSPQNSSPFHSCHQQQPLKSNPPHMIQPCFHTFFGHSWREREKYWFCGD